MNKNFIYLYHKIPIAPPQPEFDLCREKLQKLHECEVTMIHEDFAKMKQNLEEEYLVQFKKTVAMHELFVCRLASHPVFRQDPNFCLFLESENKVNKNTKISKNLMGQRIRI
jgi:sorting nexin-5/6/32